MMREGSSDSRISAVSAVGERVSIPLQMCIIYSGAADGSDMEIQSRYVPGTIGGYPLVSAHLSPTGADHSMPDTVLTKTY